MDDIREQVKQLEAQGDSAGVIRLCHDLLKRDLSADDSFFILMKLAQRLHMMNPLGWSNQTTSALNEALAVAAGNPASQVQALVALSMVEIEVGQPEQIETTLRRFEAITANHAVQGAGLYRGMIQFNIARACERVGTLQRAESYYRLALESYREHRVQQNSDDTSQRIGRALHNLAHILLKLGQLSEARAVAAEASPLIADSYGGAKKLCLQGKIAAAEGNMDAAVVLFTNALNHQSLDDRTRVDIMLAWAEGDMAAGNRAQAAARADEAYIIAVRLPYPEAVEALEGFLQQVGGEP